jgi:hypothetical protein
MGIPESEDGINRRRQTQLSHSATKTAEDYEACMQACKDELTPDIVRNRANFMSSHGVDTEG